MRNTFKTTICISAVALSTVLFSSSAMAQFGLSSLIGGSKPSGAAADPDAFIKSAQAAEALMSNSVRFLAGALSSKEKAAELDAAQKAANALTNPEEKKAKLAEVQKSELAAVNESLGNEKFKSDIAKMDDKKKESLGASAFNFMLALLKDKDLVSQGSGLISSMSSNPANFGKLGAIKDVATSVSNQVSSASQIAGKMPDIFSAVNVKVPTSKDEKPKVTAQVTGE